MPDIPAKPTTTPIPVQLSEAQFSEFILLHLSMPRRGPRCNLGSHRVFNLILWVLDTGMQAICYGGLVPNIPENPRNRHTAKRGRKRCFTEAIQALRDRVERTFAWEDKFKRVLLTM